MASTMVASSSSVDLSRLDAPTIVEQLTFDQILADMIARVKLVLPAFDATVDSDPAVKVLQVAAYQVMLIRQSFNDAARQLMVAYATGTRLDHLAALFGVERLIITPANPEAGTPTVLENDTALRQRIQLAPHSFSVAGPELAYAFHARSAHGDVSDATAVSPSPGEVVVTVLSASGTGVPAAPVLNAVRTRLNGPVRPLTDHVTVNPVELVNFVIEAELYVFAGPDQALILQTAQASLSTYLASVRRLGRDAARSAIIAALHVGNVQRVELLQPAANIAISAGQIANPTASTVTVAGTEL